MAMSMPRRHIEIPILRTVRMVRRRLRQVFFRIRDRNRMGISTYSRVTGPGAGVSGICRGARRKIGQKLKDTRQKSKGERQKSKGKSQKAKVRPCALAGCLFAELAFDA